MMADEVEAKTVVVDSNVDTALEVWMMTVVEKLSRMGVDLADIGVEAVEEELSTMAVDLIVAGNDAVGDELSIIGVAVGVTLAGPELCTPAGGELSTMRAIGVDVGATVGTELSVISRTGVARDEVELAEPQL